jgi:hypothetical protein
MGYIPQIVKTLPTFALTAIWGNGSPKGKYLYFTPLYLLFDSILYLKVFKKIEKVLEGTWMYYTPKCN